MKQAIRVAFGLLMMWATVSQAEVRIEITQGVDTARPIAVVPFKWAGPGTPPQDIGGIVAADLRNSGKFNPIDNARMPQQPTTAAEVTPAAWSALGINDVVVGQIQPGGDGSYVVSYQLVDTSAALCQAAIAAARQAKFPPPPSQAVYEAFKDAGLDFKPR